MVAPFELLLINYVQFILICKTMQLLICVVIFVGIGLDWTIYAFFVQEWWGAYLHHFLIKTSQKSYQK
jgi:hypothetical protein